MGVGAATAGLLICSNVFMTFAWYGHLRDLRGRAWYIAALVSWSIALFEYLLQVPANRIGYSAFSLAQLKIMQEVIYARRVRAVRRVLHAAAVQARLRLGRPVPARRGLFHVSRVMAKAFINVEDLRRAAQRRLPRSVFDYIDGGAEGEVTLRENVRAFEDIVFRPRCAVETPTPDIKTTVLGTPISLPVILAPVGSSRMFWPRGEEVAASVARLGRHHLFALDPVGLPSRGRQEGNARAGLVPALSLRRPGHRGRGGASARRTRDTARSS
jgi:uncharacterized protein (DUF486 family)